MITSVKGLTIVTTFAKGFVFGTLQQAFLDCVVIAFTALVLLGHA